MKECCLKQTQQKNVKYGRLDAYGLCLFVAVLQRQAGLRPSPLSVPL